MILYIFAQALFGCCAMHWADILSTSFKLIIILFFSVSLSLKQHTTLRKRLPCIWLTLSVIWEQSEQSILLQVTKVKVSWIFKLLSLQRMICKVILGSDVIGACWAHALTTETEEVRERDR